MKQKHNTQNGGYGIEMIIGKIIMKVAFEVATHGTEKLAHGNLHYMYNPEYLKEILTNILNKETINQIKTMFESSEYFKDEKDNKGNPIKILNISQSKDLNKFRIFLQTHKSNPILITNGYKITHFNPSIVKINGYFYEQVFKYLVRYHYTIKNIDVNKYKNRKKISKSINNSTKCYEILSKYNNIIADTQIDEKN